MFNRNFFKLVGCLCLYLHFVTIESRLNGNETDLFSYFLFAFCACFLTRTKWNRVVILYISFNEQ
jgi:hypothetical protein